MVAESSKQLKSICYSHLSEALHPFHQKVCSMCNTANVFINLFFVYFLSHKSFNIDSWCCNGVFKAINKCISVLYINSITEAFFFILVIPNLIQDINSIILIALNGILLLFGTIAQPFIQLICIMIKIRCLLVDFVKMSFIGGKKDEFMNVYCAQVQQFSGIFSFSQGLELIKKR